MSDSTQNGPSSQELGPFFAWEPLSSDEGWRRLAEDLANPAALQEWVERQRQSFARGIGCATQAVDARATASVLHLGISARVAAPWILSFCVPDEALAAQVSWERLRWIPDGTTRFRLGLVLGEPLRGREGKAGWARRFVEEIVEPLSRCAVTSSSRTARGNILSSLHGALVTIGRARPEMSARAQEFADAVLEEMKATSECSGRVGDGDFARRSCCQMYRLDGAGQLPVCADCVLNLR